MKIFQSDISCPRAIASCLPGVGPFFSFYNVFKTSVALKNLENKVILAFFSACNTHLSAASAILSRSKETLEGEMQKIDQIEKNLKGLEETYSELLNKSIDHSKCGIISSLLTVAATATLLALGILFSIPMGISLIGGFSVFALNHYFIFSAAKKKLNEPQITLPESERHVHFASDQVSGSHAPPAAFRSHPSDDEPDFPIPSELYS